MAEVIIRPDGRAYRPRTVSVAAWDDDEAGGGDCGVFVLGTHDVDAATAEALPAARYWFEARSVVDPQRVWVRSGLDRGEQVWVEDPVRGRAAVRFTASDDPANGDTDG